MFEELAPKRTGAFRDVFLIIVGGFVLLSLPNWLPALFDFPYVKAVYEFLVLVGIGLLIFRFLRSYTTEYRYVLVDDVFSVIGKVGARETVYLRVSLTSESTLTKLSESSSVMESMGMNPREITYGVSKKNAAFLLTYPLQNGKQGVIFQPSEQFVEILQQLLLDKREKM
jgi:hypothetical protein